MKTLVKMDNILPLMSGFFLQKNLMECGTGLLCIYSFSSHLNREVYKLDSCNFPIAA